MESALREVPTDQYGNRILTGYRQPFQKGNDPRRFKGRARYKCLTQADASRVLAKMEKILDEMRGYVKRPKRGSKPSLQRKAMASTVEPAKAVSPVNPASIPPIPPTPDDCLF